MMAQTEVEKEIPMMKENISQELLVQAELEEEDGVTLHDLESTNENDGQDQDPYDNFMRRHLQHYGYFTGRNASFRNNYDGLENWQRNYDLRLSGTHSLSVDEEQLKKMGHYHTHKNSQLDTGFGQFFAEGQPPDELLSRTTQLVFHYQAGKKIPKLREPRNLYALTKEPGPQQATRWPSHMQVVCSPIHFIDYTPPVPDPFYIPTGKEPTPAVRGTPSGEIVYLNDPGRDVYFMRSRVAGCRMAMRDISLTPRESVDEGNFTLEFESRFESGNLLKAVKINNFDYELTLRPDLYTDKHTQWYFFRVRNMVPNETYRFTIVNLMKPSSLYNNGMKPLFYSEANAKKSKIGWTRAGTDIRYYRNNLHSMSGRTFYSLTWTIQFPHKDDTCYFAHCYPYTYTDLQEYLLKLANDPVRSRFCKQRVLCRTLAGNLVYVLTVTSPSRNPEIARAKKAVVLTARVHPGETNASWMMKGFLDFLSGNSADAKLLRDNFIFKIVPMLNPDGVIVGNYRCSLAGRDLNRNYKSFLKDSFPSVYHVKMMVKKLNMEREIILYCDLHGHSRKNNVFIYGCENKNNPQRKFRERIFPLMLSKNAATKFSYESCKFKVQKSKEGTGRVVMWCMGIMNSYTMEATFGGTSLGSRKGTHFSTRDLEEMGHNFCDTLLDYCDPETSKAEACYQEIQDRVRSQILKKMQMKNLNGSLSDVDIDDYSSEYESDTSGSDSSCDDGLPVHLLALKQNLQRKRRLKTRRDRNKQTVRKTSAPVQEEPKPTPSHGAKSAAEKPPKPIRYSQTAGNKRREDNPTVSVSTSAHAPGFHTEERVTKKASQSYRTNKATFVQFAPPRKLLTDAMLAQQHQVPQWQRRTIKNSSPIASSEPSMATCIQTKALADDTKTHLKNYFKAVLARTEGMLSDCNESVDGNTSSNVDKDKKQQWLNLTPSILAIKSQVKVPEGLNLGELISYSTERRWKDRKPVRKKISTDETGAVRLIQPKLDFPKPNPRLFQHTMRNSLASGKSIKIDQKQAKPRPQTEPALVLSQKRISGNLPVIKEPGRPPKTSPSSGKATRGRVSPLMFWNHTSSGTPLPKDHDKPKFPRTKSEQELIVHLQNSYNRVDFRQNDAYVSTCQPLAMAVEGDHLNPPSDKEKIVSYLQSKRSRARQNAKHKIELYEPKLALSLTRRENRLKI